MLWGFIVWQSSVETPYQKHVRPSIVIVLKMIHAFLIDESMQNLFIMRGYV